MTRLLLLLALVGCNAAPVATAAPAPKDAATAAPAPTTRTLIVPSISGVVSSGWAPDWSGYAGTSTGCMRSIGSGRFAVAPMLTEGDTLLSIVVAMTGNYSVDVDVTSVAVAPNGDRFLGTLGSVTRTNLVAGWYDYHLDLTDTLVEGGMVHWFEIGADQPGACVGAIRLTVEPG